MSGHYSAIREQIDRLGPQIVGRFMARAALGDLEAQAKLLRFVLPRATQAQTPISTRIPIDLATQASARDSLARIAAAIGDRDVGLEEGVTLLDAVGRALERISVVEVTDLTERLEELERTRNTLGTTNTRIALSRANGSTPKWGNIQHHPALEHEE